MYQRHTLSNGIRIIHRHADSQVAHCGLFINTGSRDEEAEEQGLAHFIEHMIFKGTQRRKAFQVLSHMENVGGEINAFTSKEDTCIYASFLHSYYDRWLDVASDIIFHSVFPEKEIIKEKDIVIDEINSYLDSPAEQIFDDFDELIFNSHPLGRNILGTPATIKTFSRNSIKRFMDRNHTTGEMLICSVGRIDFRDLTNKVDKYFSDASPSQRQHTRQAFTAYIPVKKNINRKNHQAHCMLGNKADGLNSSQKTALSLLNNILGGPGLNSRLNMSVREKHGFCYTIESNYQPYTDAGVLSIYFGTDPAFLDKTISLITKELTRLKNNKLGSLQLKRAKMQLTGQVAISFESNLYEMLFNGKNYLNLHKTDTLEEINRRIDAVTTEQVIELANEVFADDMMSVLIYKP